MLWDAFKFGLLATIAIIGGIIAITLVAETIIDNKIEMYKCDCPSREMDEEL